MGLNIELPPPGLPAVLKHLADQAAPINAFAESFSQKIDPTGAVNEHMLEFCKATGSHRFRIGSLKQWLELMAITGSIHGTTFSMTRLFFLPQGLSYVGSSPGVTPKRFGGKFSPEDFEVVAVALATITGLEPDRAVFHPPGYARDEIKQIFQTANEESQRLKAKCRKHYEETLGADFAEFGWIFSDYFDDDGAEGVRFQSTRTTYV